MSSDHVRPHSQDQDFKPIIQQESPQTEFEFLIDLTSHLSSNDESPIVFDFLKL